MRNPEGDFVPEHLCARSGKLCKSRRDDSLSLSARTVWVLYAFYEEKYLPSFLILLGAV